MGDTAKPVSEFPSASGGVTRLAYAHAKGLGLEPDPLLKKADLSPYQIADPHIRLKVKDQIAFLNIVANALEDEFLGFHLARDVDLRELGLLYYALASSDTLIDALQRTARYSSIVNDGVSQKCIDGRMVGMSLQYVGVRRHLDRHQIEFWMTIIVRACRQLTGRQLLPSCLRLIHWRDHCRAEFREFFGDDIQFGASTDEIAFAPKIKHLPVVGADPYLNKLLVTYCEEALSHRPTRSSFRTTVENAIVPLLPHGKARAELAAHQLGMSKRTFARRLSMEGVTFSELLESLRYDLAHRYLADEALSITQIAWLLGYQEVGAFSHAFKRWTGNTPREARALEPREPLHPMSSKL